VGSKKITSSYKGFVSFSLKNLHFVIRKMMLALQKVKLTNGIEVFLIFKKSKCKSYNCKQEIYWAKTSNGKIMPIELCESGEWQSHFASCPSANKW
jgi:hypothetical protein